MTCPRCNSRSHMFSIFCRHPVLQEESRCLGWGHQFPPSPFNGFAYLQSVRALTLSFSPFLFPFLSVSCSMQYWARRLEQEIDGVMRIFGGVQQLRGVSCLSFTCGAFLVAMNVLNCRYHLCEHSNKSPSQLPPCAGSWLAVLLVVGQFDAFIECVGVCSVSVCLSGCMLLLSEHVPVVFFLYDTLNAS